MDNVSLSDSKSEEDLVPIVALKEDAQKRVLASVQVVGFGSKTPCVFGLASHTRARRNTQGRTTTIPKPIVPKSHVKSFFERNLLKGKMVFPSSDPCLAELWLKIEAQGWNSLFLDRNAFVAKTMVVDFFKHFSISRGCVTAKVGKVLVVFNSATLGSLLDISCTGFDTCQKNKQPNLPSLLNPMDIVRNAYKFSCTDHFSSHQVVIDVKRNHALPYRFLLTKVFAKLGVRFSSLEYYSTYNALDYFETRGSHQTGGMDGSSSVAGSSPSKEPSDTMRLEMENKSLHLELEQLKAQLA
ncbi:hypothetical protein HAX54_045195 [Datura stramonium]|uniref:Uncharacterized protein n=1 Tax=Datura stramonium TaxID=4076 RepID=A0ABS8SQJ7_DATST|nr:hypothetical protein [Datura stramonium]